MKEQPMAQIIPFPVAERIEVWSGTDKASGMPVTVLDFVGKDGRFGVGYYLSRKEAAHAIARWQADGVKIVQV